MGVLESFAQEFDRCWICGGHEAGWRRLEIHHICRGSARAKTRDERCALIRACNECHAGHLAAMPIAQQLAYKMIHDGHHYNRLAVNSFRGRAPDSVSEVDVAVEVAKLFRTRGVLR